VTVFEGVDALQLRSEIAIGYWKYYRREVWKVLLTYREALSIRA